MIKWKFLPPGEKVTVVYTKYYKAHNYQGQVYIQFFDGTEVLIVGRKVYLISIG